MNDYDLEKIRNRVLGRSMDFHVHNWNRISSADEIYAKRKSINFLWRWCCGQREWVIRKRITYRCTSCGLEYKISELMGWGCLKCHGLTRKD